MSTDAGSIAAAYFQAWQARDFAALRSLLADDVTFDGPLARLDNADDCVKGLEGMSKILERIAIRKTFVDGDDVLTWFDLHTTVAEPVPTASWSRIRDGRIAEIRVAFDARPLAPPDAG
jgi:ketosteroid isomerase-like protein